MCVAAALIATSCTVATQSNPAAPPATEALEPLPTVTVAPTTGDPDPTTTTTTIPPRGLVPANSLHQPWGNVLGLTMFRGNPTHTYHGTGPIPHELVVLWRFTDKAMFGSSSIGGVD